MQPHRTVRGQLAHRLLGHRRFRAAALGAGLATALVVGAVPLVGLVQNANAAPLLSDSFDAGMTGWARVGGSWRAQDGVLVQTRATTARARAIKGSGSWSDYTVTAAVSLRATSPVARTGTAGVLGRVVGSSRYVRLSVSSTGNASLDVINGSRSTNVGRAAVTVKSGYTLSLEATGTTVRGLVDGKLVAAGTAADLPATGRIGLMTTHASAAFDDVVVAPGPGPTPTVTPTPTVSPSPVVTPTPTLSTTPTPTVSPSPVVTPTPTPTPTPTNTPTPTGRCNRPVGSAPAVRVSDVNVGSAVTGYGREGDTDPLPMAIAARPDGGSWLSWLGTDGRVHLGRLDCDDKLVGTPTTFTGIDLQDVAADADGGVLLLTRDGNQGSGKLCGGTSSPSRTMWMVRFDNSGKEVWSTQVTNLTPNRGGYDSGARFVWWYQHHGRLAFDGTNYAAYFGVAITVQNGNCVDIHEGDRMQVVGPNGQLVAGKGAFDFGCSHAWQSRIVWDPAANKFVMVCATDNNCRIAQPSPYRTVAQGTCDGTLFGGDLVLAAGRPGYWTAWSQGGSARLERFTTGATEQTVSTGARTQHPHLVTYSGTKMLLAWESGNQIAAQVYDAGSGATVGSQFTVPVPDHSYQAFKAYSDGSTAYPAAGSTSTSIRVARVMPVG